MKLLVDRLAEEAVQESFIADAAWYEAHLAQDSILGAPHVEALAVTVSARLLGADLLLEGILRGQTELTCSRCLARYRAPIHEQFRLVLEPAGNRVPSDPEGAEALSSDGLALGDELETGWFRGPEICLDRFVAELVILAFPVQPLCREDCRGLCPQCGGDRNEQNCDCAEVQPQSPFGALEKIRGAFSRGEDEGETR